MASTNAQLNNRSTLITVAGGTELISAAGLQASSADSGSAMIFLRTAGFYNDQAIHMTRWKSELDKTCTRDAEWLFADWSFLGPYSVYNLNMLQGPRNGEIMAQGPLTASLASIVLTHSDGTTSQVFQALTCTNATVAVRGNQHEWDVCTLAPSSSMPASSFQSVVSANFTWNNIPFDPTHVGCWMIMYEMQLLGMPTIVAHANWSAEHVAGLVVGLLAVAGLMGLGGWIYVKTRRLQRKMDDAFAKLSILRATVGVSCSAVAEDAAKAEDAEDPVEPVLS